MNLRQVVIERGLAPGDRGSLTRTFTSDDVLSFARITGDMNPYHCSRRFAEASRFRQPIAHGLLVGGMLTEIGGQWAWLATGMNFNFLAPVFPGDTITLELEVVSQDEHGLTVAEGRWTNQEGVVVITGGLSGYPPTPEQRKLMGEEV